MTGCVLPPEPIPDADSAPFWDALREGILTYQSCANCGHAQLYFRAMCKTCWSRALEVVPASGLGTVYSFTIVHQAGHAGLAGDVPYTLGLVDLDEGPRLLARLAPEAGAIGARVRAATFAAGAFNLLRFDPVEAAR